MIGALGLFLVLASFCNASTSHIYKAGDEIILWLNRIGPYHNPQVAYSYYSLPFCEPLAPHAGKKTFTGGIGETLEGNQLIDSGVKINFKIDSKGELCTKTFTEEDAERFKYSISQHYWYQAYLDDLPMWGMVGEIEGTEEELLEMEAKHEVEHEIRNAFVYTTKKLSIAYNGEQIIEVNLTSDNPVPAKAGQVAKFTYEVVWESTDKLFNERFNRYLDYSFFEHQIHWFSIFNSFMMVVFLCGLVALILVRTLNNDYVRFTRKDDEELDDSEGLGDESGWKQVHGDVFRMPDYFILLVACVGTGSQMVVLAFVVVLLSIVGSLYVDRGALLSAVLVVYALSSSVSGYVSGSYFRRYETAFVKSKTWMKAMVLTASLFPIFALLLLGVLNCIALYHATINIIPLTTFLSIIAIFLFVSLPLTFLGTMIGRHIGNAEGDFPCRVNVLPRPIPPRTALTHPMTIIFLTGILPFGAVFIEIFFIFSSMWSHKYYYVYGFLLLVLIILIVVSVCVTIVAVYFQLNSEDYRWSWTSFLASASTAVYVFLYGIYYFYFKTNMTGFIQTAYFFGYLLLLSVSLAFLCGSLGYMGASMFVRRIFRNIKVD